MKALSTTGWTVETCNGTTISGSDDFANNLDQEDLEKWKSIGSTDEIQSIVNNQASFLIFCTPIHTLQSSSSSSS